MTDFKDIKEHHWVVGSASLQFIQCMAYEEKRSGQYVDVGIYLMYSLGMNFLHFLFSRNRTASVKAAFRC